MDKLIEDTRPCQYSNTVFLSLCVWERLNILMNLN